MLLHNACLHIYPSSRIWTEATAEHIYVKAIEAVRERGRFAICLAGGNTPKAIYRRLSMPPYHDQFPWDKSYFFWGDERCVPSDHQDSNFRMVKETLLDKVPIPQDHLYPINGDMDPHEAAALYEKELQLFFEDKQHTFDLTLLGLGDDGHTASLFPNSDILEVKDQLVKSVFLVDKKLYRISVTAPALNRSHHIAFLVKGESKQAALGEVLQGDKSFRDFPAKLIRLASGAVDWFLDQPAARGLRI